MDLTGSNISSNFCGPTFFNKCSKDSYSTLIGLVVFSYSLFLFTRLGLKLKVPGLVYSVADIAALVIFLQGASLSQQSGKAGSTLYFSILIAVLAGLYMTSVSRSNIKWFLYDAIVVGGMVLPSLEMPWKIFG